MARAVLLAARQRFNLVCLQLVLKAETHYFSADTVLLLFFYLVMFESSIMFWTWCFWSSWLSFYPQYLFFWPGYCRNIRARQLPHDRTEGGEDPMFTIVTKDALRWGCSGCDTPQGFVEMCLPMKEGGNVLRVLKRRSASATLTFFFART